MTPSSSLSYNNITLQSEQLYDCIMCTKSVQNPRFVYETTTYPLYCLAEIPNAKRETRNKTLILLRCCFGQRFKENDDSILKQKVIDLL